MRKRLPYLIGFIVLLAVEICIGVFIQDDFVRPYVGDLLVTVLLCCLGRVMLPDGFSWMPTVVFAFAVAVECTQLIHIPALEGTIWDIILGSTFDWADIVCYGIGCAGFAVLDGCFQAAQKT